jgi:hypothetical protein
MIKPPDALNGRKLYVIDAAPGTAPSNHSVVKRPITDFASALSYESPDCRGVKRSRAGRNLGGRHD